MPVLTTNLSLNKPVVGADSDLWGGFLNDNMDILDVAILDKRTGGSITGDVSISGNVTANAFIGSLSGNATTATTLQTARTISLGGDLSGSASFNGGANVTITATIQPNSVTLGTDTVGDYLAGVTAGSAITVTGVAGEGANLTINHADTSSQGSVNNSGNTFIQDITLDGFGHITGLVSGTTSIGNGTVTVQGTSGLTGSGSFSMDQATNTTVTIQHADTSAQASVNNAGNTFIQDITLDGFGHLTGLVSATVTGTITETTGSPPYYGARAWVNFNGTNTVAIQASANVSSITDLGLGYYQVNFSTAMPDNNYAVSGCAQYATTDNLVAIVVAMRGSPTAQQYKLTSSVRVVTTFDPSSGVNAHDSNDVCVTIHR